MKKFYKSLMSIATAGVIALAPCGSVFATSQDETVYVKLQASGEVKNIAVTEHLLNDNHSQELESASILQNIENLNGLESFTTINGKSIWKANGNDIYYRGTTDKELPLKLNVKYFLDGVEKPVDEVIGKAGKIEIHLHYENLSKQGDLYTPFVVAVATTLDEKNVSNVNVTNGKVISTGRKIAVSAVATPGLYESLGIDELRGSDTVTISFETSKFELGDIYSIATPKVIDSADLKKYTDLSDVYTKMDKLSSSSQKLVAGSKTLTEGLLKLQQGVNGINNKLVLPENLIDETKMAQIKAAAKAQAEQNIEAQRATLTAGMVQQIKSSEDFAVLRSALNLQATQACQARYGENCNETIISQIYDQLVNGVATSYVETMKQTAGQTAEQVAATVATQTAEQVKNTVMPMIKKSLSSLNDGISQLVGGSSELSQGVAQFDNEGIQPLYRLVNGDLRGVADKINRLGELADNYNNYAGIAAGTTGETKFVMMIEAKY